MEAMNTNDPQAEYGKPKDMSQRRWSIDGKPYDAEEALVFLLHVGLISPSEFAEHCGRCFFTEELELRGACGAPVEIIGR